MDKKTKSQKHWENLENGIKKTVDLGDKPLKEAPQYIPEGIGGDGRKKIGVKTERKTRKMSDFTEEVYVENTENQYGRVIGERDRVSRRLKKEATEWYITSDDHAKKIRTQGKGTAKIKVQKETANAFQIIKAQSKSYELQKIQNAWEHYPISIEFNTFKNRVLKIKSFRKKVKKLTGWDFSYMDK